MKVFSLPYIFRDQQHLFNVLNLSIGLCTPPVGSILFVSCAMAKIRLTQIMRPLMWMYLVLFISLLIVTYVPELSEWLPRKAGLI